MVLGSMGLVSTVLDNMVLVAFVVAMVLIVLAILPPITFPVRIWLEEKVLLTAVFTGCPVTVKEFASIGVPRHVLSTAVGCVAEGSKFVKLC